jgi:hypothetical protein
MMKGEQQKIYHKGSNRKVNAHENLKKYGFAKFVRALLQLLVRVPVNIKFSYP